MTRPRHIMKKVKVVDLFCGIGGLSHGLVQEGFQVVAGVDNDPSCKYAFEANNSASFINRDIARFTARELNALYGDAGVRILVGCAPCPPYSFLTRRGLSDGKGRQRDYPMKRFMNLIRRVQPDIVSMENVPDLSNVQKYPVFGKFLRMLKNNDYHVSYKTVDASRYGVPQRRRRLVLLASKLGEISLIPETHDDERLVTVRQAIGSLPPIQDGATHHRDPLHRASKLSTINKRRILATPKDGGSAKDWPRELIPDCYKRKTGKSFMATVYGRMRWDDVAPTMTTNCATLGTGRFGHPSQNRAISLREAAIFQTFPSSYDFGPLGSIQDFTRHLGNAVPVSLARAIGQSIRKHIEDRSLP